MKTFIFLIFLIYINIATINGHELCTDGGGKKNIVMSWCQEYTQQTCCSAEKEQQLLQTWTNLYTDVNICKDIMKKLLCSQCDPWGAHLFESESDPSSYRQIPLLCPLYTEKVYSACVDQVMQWNNQTNPFNSTIIRQTYPTLQSFQTAFQVLNNVDSCYNGTLFIPKSPPEFHPDSSICLKSLAIPSSNNDRLIALIDPKDGNDRLYGVYHRGVVDIFQRSNGQRISNFMQKTVLYDGEAGLIGMAFHPNYIQNGRFFISWTCPLSQCSIPCSTNSECEGGVCQTGFCIGDGGSHVMVLSEYARSTGNYYTANMNSEKRILSIFHRYRNHNAGGILFDKYGMLFWATGDGGAGNDPSGQAQNLNRWAGKILRIDINSTPLNNLNYSIPSTNPFVQSNNRKEIWAYGFRNPWKCSFDALDSNFLYCGDVGQDTREEFNIVIAGGNYGWRKYEGDIVNPAYPSDPVIPNKINPIITYRHSDVGGGPSAIGGYIYRSNADPCYYGRYIHADWEGILFAAEQRSAGTWAVARIGWLCTPDSTNCYNRGNIFSFAEDINNDIYILSSQGVYKIVEPYLCSITECLQSTISAQTTEGNSGYIEYLSSINDAHVRGGTFSNINYGRDVALQVKYDSNQPLSFARETYLRFDLSSLVIYKDEIASVILLLQIKTINADVFFDFSWNLLATNYLWNETQITWANKPTAFSIARPTSRSIGSTNISIPITSFVQDYLNRGQLIMEIRLFKSIGSDIDLLTLHSREATTALGPNLVISYDNGCRRSSFEHSITGEFNVISSAGKNPFNIGILLIALFGLFFKL